MKENQSHLHTCEVYVKFIVFVVIGKGLKGKKMHMQYFEGCRTEKGNFVCSRDENKK